MNRLCSSVLVFLAVNYFYPLLGKPFLNYFMFSIFRFIILFNDVINESQCNEVFFVDTF